MAEFSAKDSDDNTRVWKLCSNVYCKCSVGAHYHSEIVDLPHSQKKLDDWVLHPPKDYFDEPKWTAKRRRWVRRTPVRQTPYEKVMANELAKANHVSKMKD